MGYSSHWGKNKVIETVKQILSHDTTYLSLQLIVAVYENMTIAFQVKFFDSNRNC